MNLWIYGAGQDRERKKITSTRTTRYITLLSVVIALALTAVLAACGSDERSGVTGPDRTASPTTETPASPARTPSTTGSGDAPTATDTPVPTAATAPPAASGSAETDRAALVALNNALDGWNWKNWLSDAPLSEWSGVKTDDDGRVIGLDLSHRDLFGEIPPELGSLPLFSLTLEGNDFSGCVPSILERRLRNDPDPLPFC